MSLFVVAAFVALFGVIALGVLSHQRAVQQWESLPTLRRYLLRYPECKTEQGICCCKCGAGSIRDRGMLTRRDSNRTYVCNYCGAELFRSS